MRVFATALLLFAVYFPVAVWLVVVREEPAGPMQPLPVFGVNAAGLCVSRIWQPEEMKKVEVYDGGVSRGYAMNVYDDPGRLEMAVKNRRWKLVEFPCDKPRLTLFHALPAK